MTYKEFRMWTDERTRKGSLDFRVALICFYTVKVMDAVPNRKRERVWRQYQNIINVQKIVKNIENPPKITQYDRMRGLSLEGMAKVIDHFEEVAAMPCNPQFCQVHIDGICHYVGKEECHQASVNWLKSVVDPCEPFPTDMRRKEPIEVE